jgi:hypothetical protein
MQNRLALALMMLGAATVLAQGVVSARSGMIHYVEGRVLLDGQPVHLKFAEFPEIKVDHTLTTEDGQAEVLLTPGAFLRLKENSALRMISNRRSDTVVEVLAGSALFEVDELYKDNAITIQLHGVAIALPKRGLYRIDADLPRLRVYNGKARIISGTATLIAKRGSQVKFGDVLLAEHFDPKDTDAFYQWSTRRSAYIAAASDSLARWAGERGVVFPDNSCSAWNAWFGVFSCPPGNEPGYGSFGVFGAQRAWFDPSVPAGGGK